MDNSDFENLYNLAVEEMNAAKSIANFKAVEEKLRQLGGFKDSAELAEQCLERQRLMTYKTALYEVKVGGEESLKSAAKKFESIIDYEDSAEQLQKCREMLENSERDFSFIVEIASLISDNDKAVVKNLKAAVKNPKQYFKKNAKRFAKRSMDIDDYSFDWFKDIDEVLWVAMIDELNAGGYLFEACGEYETEAGGFMPEVYEDYAFEDFISKLQKMKAYSLLSDAVPERIDEDRDELYGLECLFGKIDLDDEDDDVWGVDLWCMQLNAVLDGKAIVGYVDNDNEYFNLYPLIIVSPEVLAKVGKIAGENGHSIVAFR